jgi:hypothetical protein
VIDADSARTDSNERRRVSNGDGPGGLFMMDHRDSFDVLGRCVGVGWPAYSYDLTYLPPA